MPARLRAASITAICMPKQIPKYGTLCSARKARRQSCPRRRVRRSRRDQNAVRRLQDDAALSSVSKICESIQFELDLHSVGDAAMVSASRAIYRHPAVRCICRRRDLHRAFGLANASEIAFQRVRSGLLPLACRNGGRPRRRGPVVVAQRHLVDAIARPGPG